MSDEIVELTTNADDIEVAARAARNGQPTFSDIVADMLARAWDEGHRFTGYEPARGENPYRDADQ